MREVANCLILHLSTEDMIMATMVAPKSTWLVTCPAPVAQALVKDWRRLLKKVVPQAPPIQAAAKPVAARAVLTTAVAKWQLRGALPSLAAAVAPRKRWARVPAEAAARAKKTSVMTSQDTTHTPPWKPDTGTTELVVV